jgi:hypothetical protein
MTDLPARLMDSDPSNTEDWPADLATAVRDELVHLWYDLHQARRYANRGRWSLQCENVTYRIVALSRLTEPTDWSEVDVTLVRSGLYERIHRDAGIEYPPIDWDRLAECERRIAESARVEP